MEVTSGGLASTAVVVVLAVAAAAVGLGVAAVLASSLKVDVVAGLPPLTFVLS